MRRSRNDPIASIDWSEPISVGGQMTLREAATVLDRYGVGATVVRAGDDIGMLSERDIVAALAAGGDPDKLWSGDVMTPTLVSVAPATTIAGAARLMLSADVRHLVITDDDGIVGVISMRDLFTLFVEEEPPE